MGILGDYENNKDYLTMDFVGQNILNKNLFENLLKESGDIELGLGTSSLNSKGKIPTFKYGDNIIIKKLDQMVNETKTINGDYKIVGLNEEDMDVFLSGLSKVSGVSRKFLIDNKSGYFIDRKVQINFLSILLISHIIVLLAIFVVITINSLSRLGKFILQGWSKFGFCLNLYKKYLLVSFWSIFLFIIYGLFLTEGLFKSLIFFSLMLLLGIISFLIIFILMLISALFIFVIKPIDAIREKFSKRVYLGSSVFIYLIFNFLLILMCAYIDGPYKEIEKNYEVSKQWEEVSNYYIVESVDVGKDESSFNNQLKKFQTDTYRWYKSIADDEGVNIINTTYFSDDILEEYKENNLYEEFPNNPIWLYILSSNYIKDLGIDINLDMVNKAKNGSRLYLLPNNLGKKEQDLIKKWLIEKDIKSIRPDDIATIFNKEKNSLHGIQKILDITKISYPVILVSTPENMIFMESESLVAKGLKSSFLKLKKEAIDKYVNKSYLSKFNLDDNNIKFTSIRLFIDGIQKNLWKTIQLFFILIIAISLVIFALLITLTSIFQLSYQERIFVKKFLGYSNFRIYEILAMIIAISIILSIILMIIIKSKIGIIYTSLIGLLQLFIFYKVITKNEFKKIMEFLKS